MSRIKGVVSANDVWDNIMEAHKRWEEQKRVGFVSFDENCNCITFHFDTTGDRYRYWIGLSRIQEPIHQMQWLNHLRQKSWFTLAVFNDFMAVLEYMGLLPEGLGA